jgi:hypothetical protein
VHQARRYDIRRIGDHQPGVTLRLRRKQIRLPTMDVGHLVERGIEPGEEYSPRVYVVCEDTFAVGRRKQSLQPAPAAKIHRQPDLIAHGHARERRTRRARSHDVIGIRCPCPEIGCDEKVIEPFECYARKGFLLREREHLRGCQAFQTAVSKRPTHVRQRAGQSRDEQSNESGQRRLVLQSSDYGCDFAPVDPAASVRQDRLNRIGTEIRARKGRP